jgi:hypothetical protein
MEDLHNVGGTPAVLKYMLREGYLHGDCLTITGKTLAENLAELPDLTPGQDVIYPFEERFLFLFQKLPTLAHELFLAAPSRCHRGTAGDESDRRRIGGWSIFGRRTNRPSKAHRLFNLRSTLPQLARCTPRALCFEFTLLACRSTFQPSDG